MTSNALGVLVEIEVKMYETASKKDKMCAAAKKVRKSVPSKWPTCPNTYLP